MSSRKRRGLEAPASEESSDHEFGEDFEEDSASAHDRRAEDEEKLPAPVLDAKTNTITFHTILLNKHLVCALCSGYFRDAYTIKECLHTFCKVCLFKYFLSTKDCPTCHAPLTPDPYDHVAADRQLQQLVAKIFPELVKQDEEEENAFWAARGVRKEERAGTAQAQSQATPARPASAAKKNKPARPAVTAPVIPHPDEPITFDLELDERDPKLCEGLVKLDKKLITTSAKVTVSQLKKFLLIKQPDESKPSINDIDLVYRDEVLGAEHTLEFILKTRGSRGEVPLFHFRRRKQP